MIRWLDGAANALLWLLGLGLLAMVGLSMFNVVSRYVFNSALLWADEVAVFAMIAMTWLAAIAAAWRGTEIRMDILVGLLPPEVRRWLMVGQQALIAVLCSWVALQSLTYVARAFRFGMRSDAAGLPVWVLHALIPASLFLTAAIALLRGLRMILGRGDSLRPAPLQTEKPS